MYKKMQTIEKMMINLGAISAIAIPGFITGTWTSKSDAKHFARVLLGIRIPAEVFADPEDNGNWIVSANIT